MKHTALTKTQQAAIKGKITRILKKSTLAHADIDKLKTREERQMFNSIVNQHLNSLKGEDLDRFRRKIDPVLELNSKSMLWELNHLKITNFINTYVDEYGSMPNKTKISEGTDLSRVTIHKHFDEYEQGTDYKSFNRQFRIMRDKVLAKLFQFTKRGDVKAARLFLEATGGIGFESTSVQTQTNYIQINNLTISQEKINSLPVDRKRQIEALCQALCDQEENVVAKGKLHGTEEIR